MAQIYHFTFIKEPLISVECTKTNPMERCPLIDTVRQSGWDFRYSIENGEMKMVFDGFRSPEPQLDRQNLIQICTRCVHNNHTR